ncbi:hypothetical protein IG631_03666 [Alternaria alternata]|nr:hypothetical protein IG631_03666 [Alternaria alternata]
METRPCQARHGIPTVRRKPRTGPWVEVHTCPKPADGEMLGATQSPLAASMTSLLGSRSWHGRRVDACQHSKPTIYKCIAHGAVPLGRRVCDASDEAM